METKELYSPKEAAEILMVNKEHILRSIKSGKLAAANIGSGKRAVYRISAKDIAKYLQNCKQNGQPRPSEN